MRSGHELGKEREQKKWRKKKTLETRSKARMTKKKAGGTGEEGAPRLRKVEIEEEQRRLQFQFEDKDCRCNWAMNYGMTFMGQRVEAVRSQLAEWVHHEHKKRKEGKRISRFRRML